MSNKRKHEFVRPKKTAKEIRDGLKCLNPTTINPDPTKPPIVIRCKKCRTCFAKYGGNT